MRKLGEDGSTFMFCYYFTMSECLVDYYPPAPYNNELTYSSRLFVW